MFDILIGTVIDADAAITAIPKLNAVGFESYELDFNGTNPAEFDFESYAKQVNAVLDGRKIAAIGYYKNPLMNENERKNIEILIKNAHLLGCNVIGTFAGGNPEKSVPETIPEFKAAWEPLARLAEENGVKIGFEACGCGWDKGCRNIGFCSDAWELMFEAVPSEALGLEWEPSHALTSLADPIIQLRKWAKKVVHIHGKDATIAWDVIKAHGIDSPERYDWDRTPGFGDTNWADVFTILLQNGFEGSCDIEGYHDPVHYDDMEWSAQLTALDYLKRCRGGVTYFAGPAECPGYQGKRKK